MARDVVEGAGPRSSQWRLAHAALLVAALLVGVVPGAAGVALAQGAAAANAPAFDFSRDQATVVVSYRENAGELAGNEGAWMRVYGDGLALIHYPSAMKRGGDYSVRLSPPELAALVRDLVSNGVVEFDELQTREACNQARSGRSVVEYSSDPETVSIELRLDRYAPAQPGARVRRNVYKRISWRGLRRDARRYPDVESIQKLAAARHRLEAVMERDDLVRSP